MKGYINKALADLLFDDGIQLINAVKRNMKQKALSNEEKLLLRKRSVIKTVKDELKNIYQVEHTSHRSIAGFFLNIMSTIVAYSFPHNLLLKRISKKLILLLYNNSISQN
jgi:hypothetical protein